MRDAFIIEEASAAKSFLDRLLVSCFVSVSDSNGAFLDGVSSSVQSSSSQKFSSTRVSLSGTPVLP